MASYDTGHGATITFGTTGFTAKVRRIGAVEQEREKVEDTALDNSDYKSYLPGDLAEPGELEIDFSFDSEMSVEPPLLSNPETITITFPKGPNQSDAATLAGTGFVTKRTMSPEFATGQLQQGKLSIAFDGKTGPAFTAGTPGS